MRLLFAVIGILGFSLSATAASEWLYYKHYPWVYDNVSKDWLYLRGSSDGEVYAYRSNTNEWEVFEAPEPTWEEKYEEWIQNPEPYGGLVVLQQIKEAKDSGAWQLVLENKNISDISPLDGLNQFYYLNLEGNIIADISSLASLTNLESLDLDQNNIADVSPLAGLTTLTGLELGGNNITNLTALSSLTNLNYLDLDGNPLSSEQKNLITEALPNTDLWFGN